MNDEMALDDRAERIRALITMIEVVLPEIREDCPTAGFCLFMATCELRTKIEMDLEQH